MKRMAKLAVVPAVLLAAAGCDYSGDWLFAGAVDGVPGIQHLGELTPAEVASYGDVAPNVVYGEVGPTGTAEKGGVTFTFTGTGETMCLWVDPEVASWNQSVGLGNTTQQYSYPDNVFDDGDLDMSAGLSVYYTGSPGEAIGDFRVRYEDDLGEEVEIELNECTMVGFRSQTGAHAGRGYPEYCTLTATSPGVSYTVLLETWSTPLDDDRLGFGMLLAKDSCRRLNTRVGVPDECVIMGESVDPDAADASPGPWYGEDAVPTAEQSLVFEAAFCASTQYDYCLQEAEAAEEAGSPCTLPLCGADESPAEDDCRVEVCYCGDPTDTPSGGSY